MREWTKKDIEQVLDIDYTPVIRQKYEKEISKMTKDVMDDIEKIRQELGVKQPVLNELKRIDILLVAKWKEGDK